MIHDPNKVRRLARLAAALLRDTEEMIANSYSGGALHWRDEWKRADPDHHKLCDRLKKAIDDVRKR